MSTLAHYNGRVLATAGAAGAHGYLSVIGAFDLLNFTIPTRYALLEMIASEGYWAWIHAGVAVLLLGSLLAPTAHLRIRCWYSALPLASLACSIGFTMMFSWFLFSMLWGLSTERPVSLAAPGLAFIVAAAEQLLSLGWARGTYNNRGR